MTFLKQNPNNKLNFEIVIQDFNVGDIKILLHNDEAEIVYSIKKEWRNRKIGTEAVKEIVRYIFKEMHISKIWADLFCDNIASKRVLEKAKFIKDENIINRKIPCDGELKDTMRYYILSTF